MRTLLVLVLCGCPAGGSKQTTKPTAEAPSTSTSTTTAGAPALPDVTRYIAPEVTGLLKSDGASFPSASYVSSLLKSPPPCWSKLRGAITNAYQLELPPSSYFILEGNLPEREVETCVTQAFASVMPLTVERDGDLFAFRSKAGVVYAKWSEGFIIAGTKDQVTRALATPESKALWSDRIAQLSPGRIVMWRSDGLFQNVLGVAATSYVMMVERFETTPRPFFAARLIARFATAGDAAIAARRIRQGELAVANAPAEIVAGFRLMKVKQNAELLDVSFDSDMFYGVELAKLQQWVAGQS